MKTIISLHNKDLELSIKLLPYSEIKSNIYDCISIYESDYEFVEIYRMYDDILVFLIPTFGGVPCFFKSYSIHSVKGLIEDLKKLK